MPDELIESSTEAQVVPELSPTPALPNPDLKENTSEPKDAPDSGPMADLPPTQVPPPTDAQYAWFAQHPGYVRISHGLGSYTDRGTLAEDGTFTPEGPGFPVLDGNGNFGVGIAM